MRPEHPAVTLPPVYGRHSCLLLRGGETCGRLCLHLCRACSFCECGRDVLFGSEHCAAASVSDLLNSIMLCNLGARCYSDFADVSALSLYHFYPVYMVQSSHDNGFLLREQVPHIPSELSCHSWTNFGGSASVCDASALLLMCVAADQNKTTEIWTQTLGSEGFSSPPSVYSGNYYPSWPVSPCLPASSFPCFVAKESSHWPMGSPGLTFKFPLLQ